MKQAAFRLLNVFCPVGSSLQGNALCVFEDGTHLSTEEMQALALQFNLSETTFLFPPTNTAASKSVRIFTPGVELPFAGHPTLGSSFVVAALDGSCSVLETKAGLIPVSSTAGDIWTLSANNGTFAAGPEVSALAALVNLATGDLATGGDSIPTTWVNAGIPQLMVQLQTQEALFAAQIPSVSQMKHLDCEGVLFFVMGEGKQITSRFFFRDAHAVFEDPGTGSACANLGRLLQRQGLHGVFELKQGHSLKRLCEIGITVEDEKVLVSGRVVQVGSGVISF
ncbi:isomerase [Obelidium mucronatum]|nr:isomerase [Obelidium mucronatum]